MTDFLNVYVAGDILQTFVNMFLVIVGLDLVTLVCMIFAKAKDSV